MAKPISEALTPALKRIIARSNGGELALPVPWASWNRAVGGGLFPGMYALVSGTGVGKTQLAVDWLNAGAMVRHPGLYVGLEMNPSDLAARILSLHSGRKWSDYLQGKVPEVQLEADIDEHWPNIEKLPLETVFAPPNGWTYDNLLYEAEDLCKKYKHLIIDEGKTPFVVLDFLQLVMSPNPVETTRQTVARAAYLGRAVASNLNAVVLVISSTSRENYKAMSGAKNDSGFRPWEDDPNLLVGTGKESGDLEFAADGLFVAVREPQTTNVWVGAAKFRLGQPGWVCMHFDGSRMREGPGVKKAMNATQAREIFLSHCPLNVPISPDLFMKFAGFKSAGDAASLRTRLLQEGVLKAWEKDAASVVRVK